MYIHISFNHRGSTVVRTSALLTVNCGLFPIGLSTPYNQVVVASGLACCVNGNHNGSALCLYM